MLRANRIVLVWEPCSSASVNRNNNQLGINVAFRAAQDFWIRKRNASHLHFCHIYTPGIYKVYRGYIVFVFSVKMFVCVCVCV